MTNASALQKLRAIWQPMTADSQYPEIAFQPDTRPGFKRWNTAYEETSYEPKDNLYRPEDFGYLINSEGFRCDELRPRDDDDLRIVFTGCSFTYGVGLPVEHTFAHCLVSKLRDEGLNVQHWNLAHGGTSIEYSVRVLYQFMPRLKPDLIVALFPNHTRREAFVPHKATRHSHLINYLPNWYRAHYDVQYLEEFYFDENILYTVANNYAFFDTIARAHKCEYLWDNWSYIPQIPDGIVPIIPPRMLDRRLALADRDILTKKPRARDHAHWGPAANKIVANALYNRMGTLIDKARERRELRLRGQ